MGFFFAILLTILPSWLKVRVLRALGHQIDKAAHIGFSFLHVENMTMGARSRIGHGNIFTRVKTIKLSEGAVIGSWNRFTSAKKFESFLYLGKNSAITLRHYFDLAGGIVIEENSIIAGHASTFFTHSKGLNQVNNYCATIEIGDWNYVGSNVGVVPGFKLGHHCFVGMGAQLVGDKSGLSYVLLAGNPAIVKKALPRDAEYFTSGDLIH